MQLAKVVIISALALAACAEGLPEGKECCIPECKITYCSSYAKVGYSKLVNCGVLTSSLVIIGKVEKIFYSHILLKIHIIKIA